MGGNRPAVAEGNLEHDRTGRPQNMSATGIRERSPRLDGPGKDGIHVEERWVDRHRRAVEAISARAAVLLFSSTS